MDSLEIIYEVFMPFEQAYKRFPTYKEFEDWKKTLRDEIRYSGSDAKIIKIYNCYLSIINEIENVQNYFSGQLKYGQEEFDLKSAENLDKKLIILKETLAKLKNNYKFGYFKYSFFTFLEKFSATPLVKWNLEKWEYEKQEKEKLLAEKKAHQASDDAMAVFDSYIRKDLRKARLSCLASEEQINNLFLCVKPFSDLEDFIKNPFGSIARYQATEIKPLAEDIRDFQKLLEQKPNTNALTQEIIKYQNELLFFKNSVKECHYYQNHLMGEIEKGFNELSDADLIHYLGIYGGVSVHFSRFSREEGIKKALEKAKSVSENFCLLDKNKEHLPNELQGALIKVAKLSNLMATLYPINEEEKQQPIFKVIQQKNENFYKQLQTMEKSIIKRRLTDRHTKGFFKKIKNFFSKLGRGLVTLVTMGALHGRMFGDVGTTGDKFIKSIKKSQEKKKKKIN